MGAPQRSAEKFYFLFEEKTGSGRKKPGNGSNRRMRPMARPESVVHVKVGHLRQFPRKGLIIFLLFRMKAQIFQKHHRALSAVGDFLLNSGADAIAALNDRSLDQRRQVIRHGL